MLHRLLAWMLTALIIDSEESIYRDYSAIQWAAYTKSVINGDFPGTIA